METPTDLTQWRKEQRALLLERRLSSPAAARAAWSRAITGHLEGGFPSLNRLVVGFCWPFKAEFDARALVRGLRDRGARAALPAVVAKGQPLQFREWWPGAAMKPAVLGIPVPDGTPVLVPDAVLIPPVGFSDQGWRLGYGGGYFDTTLAALSPQPLKIGVAYELSRIPTIHPQPHDIAMDFVVTEAGIHAVEEGGMRRVDAAECARREALILTERGLPRRQA
jgi:5,10-methenyltetrahydrofolate synthetase